MKWLLIGLVRGYQLVVSPYLGPTCRYYPSCSAYAVEALRVHGAIKGSWLAVRRLLRCHPWSPGGVDHVPSRHGHSPARVEATAERDSELLPATAGGTDSEQGA
jgi:uncharacterized protein